MKRLGYLHELICTYENVLQADLNARKHKTRRACINKHDKNQIEENNNICDMLKHLSYHTSPYKNMKIYEPKERLLYILPYYPDRIVHHAIMNVLQEPWTKTLINNTYSCIKERGIHKLVYDLKRDLRNDPNGTTYCLKIDVKKYYPSINHEVLINIILRKLKDPKLLYLLKEIIHSADGVPIGNYLSQFFANLYLNYFDHWLKEEIKCRYYYRYADDIVVLSSSKNFLRKVLILMKIYLHHLLKLTIKKNYQIFPVEIRGIDFVGYKFYHKYILLRKSIKRKLFKLINKYLKNIITKEELLKRILSYFGWLKHCNSKHLLYKIYKLTGIKYSNWNGKQQIISNVYNKFIYIVDILKYSKFFKINCIYKNKPVYICCKSKRLLKALNKIEFPTVFKIKRYEKTRNNKKYK